MPSAETAFSEHTVSQRLKQVQLVKTNHQGYKNYLASVPKRDPRNPDHPRTPDPYAPDSKRQFDGRMKAWRAKLKEYDARPATPEPLDPVIEIPGPVTLRVCNSDDEREALEIQSNNPAGAVNIIYERLTPAATPVVDEDAWLEMSPKSSSLPLPGKLYF